MPEGLLQKRVIGINVNTVEKVEKCVEGIGVVAVWKTHQYLRCSDDVRARGSSIVGAVVYAAKAGLSLYGAEPTPGLLSLSAVIETMYCL
jgi:hypothetical protein